MYLQGRPANRRCQHTGTCLICTVGREGGSRSNAADCGTIPRNETGGDVMKMVTFRRSWAAWLAAVASTCAMITGADSCRAQAPTLFQWSYGDGGDGGPDLNEPLVTDRPDFTEA